MNGLRSRNAWWVLLLAAGTVAALLPPAARDGAVRRITMVVWGMPFEDALFRDGFAAEFSAAEDVEIEYRKFDDVTAKYLAWHMLGDGVEVMRVPITDYPTLVARGALAPLDELMDDPELGLSADDRADFLPWVWDALEIDGQRYALPSDSAQYGLYYNRAIIDAHDAAHPEARIGYPDASWTWNDLLRAAEALTQRDAQGRVVVHGVDFELWAWPFITFLHQAGGRLWDEDGTTTLIDSPEGVEALELVSTLMPHAGAMRASDVRDSATGPDKLFAAGRTAIMLDGSWRAPFLEILAPDLDFAVAPLPRHRERAIVCGSVLWAVGANAKERRLGWKMIRWMTDREQSLRYWKHLRVAPPARRSVLLDPAFRTTPRMVDADGIVLAPGMTEDAWLRRGAWLLAALEPAGPGLPMSGFVPVAPYQKDLEDKIDALLNRATTPGRTASFAELLRAAADDLHRVIDRDRRARGLSRVDRRR